MKRVVFVPMNDTMGVRSRGWNGGELDPSGWWNSWHFPHKSRFFGLFHRKNRPQLGKKVSGSKKLDHLWLWSAVVHHRGQSGRTECISSRHNPPHGIESTGYVLCLNIWVHNHKQTRIQVFQLMFFVARCRSLISGWRCRSTFQESQEISYHHTPQTNTPKEIQYHVCVFYKRTPAALGGGNRRGIAIQWRWRNLQCGRGNCWLVIR